MAAYSRITKEDQPFIRKNNKNMGTDNKYVFDKRDYINHSSRNAVIAFALIGIFYIGLTWWVNIDKKNDKLKNENVPSKYLKNYNDEIFILLSYKYKINYFILRSIINEYKQMSFSDNDSACLPITTSLKKLSKQYNITERTLSAIFLEIRHMDDTIYDVIGFGDDIDIDNDIPQSRF